MARLARQHDLHYANLTEHVEETEEIQRDRARAPPAASCSRPASRPATSTCSATASTSASAASTATDSRRALQMRVGALTTTARPPALLRLHLEPQRRRHRIRQAGHRPARPPADDPPLALRARTVVHRRHHLRGGPHLRRRRRPAGRARGQGPPSRLQDAALPRPLRLDRAACWRRRRPARTRSPILQERMEATVPFIEDDLVVIYAAVEGRGADGTLRRLEKSLLIRPRRVGARTLKAIQSTTTAGLAESARLLLTEQPAGDLPAEPDRSRPVHGGPVCCRDLPPLKKSRP